VTVAAVMSLSLGHGALLGLSEWANYPWSKPVDRALLFDHLLLVGRFESSRLAPVFWTLVLEMRVSIIFPLLAMFVMRASWRSVLSCALAVSLISDIAANRVADVRVQDALGTLHYASLFAVGALQARHLDDLLSWWTKLSKPIRAAAVAGALGLYTYGRGANLLMRPLGDWPAAAGICLLFLFALSNTSLSRTLVSSVPQFLGRVSYSYYLFHVIVLLGLLHAFEGHLSLVPILGLSMLSGLLVAYASYRLVERPAIRLGRAMSEKLVKKRAGALAD
jgi:peptidoglycan/LPS O-acetylase OafA/YrhL